MGISAEARKCRLRCATRCRNITENALSSTLNASELKNSSVASRNHPTTWRYSRNDASSSTSALDWPGTTQPSARRSVTSSSAWSITWESAITIRISSGTIDSSV